MGHAAVSMGFVLASAVGVAAQQSTDGEVIGGEVGQHLARIVQRADGLGFSGAVLAARGGKVVVATAVGTADAEGRPCSPATLFEIASATKQFTAAAVLRLVQDGRLKLDDPIGEHLPGVPETCGAITVRHLLQHTSGMPGTNSMGAGDDLARVLPFFLRGGPRHAPGTHWEYWNQGYALASEVIARVGGASYTEFCRTALFASAGLSSTLFTGDAAPTGAVVALGQSDRGARSALEHPYGGYGFQYRGMGGVVTSVWDLWRWDRALRGDAVLKAPARTEFFAPGLNEYALGWFVRRDAQGRLVQSHGGGVRGFSCEIRRYPEEDACLFILANRDDAPVSGLATILATTLFGDPISGAALPSPLGRELAEAMSGTYATDDGRRLVVSAHGASARGVITWGANSAGAQTRASFGLDAEGNVVFFEWSDAPKVTLSRDEAGRVVRVTLAGMTFDRQ